MVIDQGRLIALWSLDEVPFCDEGLELAGRFMERAFKACEVNGEDDVIRTRNAVIRAHKEIVFHRSMCPKCNEAEPQQ
jgi:hypothetical protein